MILFNFSKINWIRSIFILFASISYIFILCLFPVNAQLTTITGEELANDETVQAQLEDAWNNSDVGGSNTHEEGGFIFRVRENNTNRYEFIELKPYEEDCNAETKRCRIGVPRELSRENLRNPDLLDPDQIAKLDSLPEDAQLVAFYHTHPLARFDENGVVISAGTLAPGYAPWCGPSTKACPMDSDTENIIKWGILGLVIHQNGIVVYGCLECTPVIHFDSDGDGHYDYLDAFPYDPSRWEDTDGDGLPDPLDFDDDDDGIPDNEDPFPKDKFQGCDPNQQSCGIGDSWGDPHLVTFDRLAYDFQGVGEFVLVRSLNDDLEIQTRMKPWENSRVASINNAVAMNVAGDRVGFYVGRTPTLYLNGTPTTLETEMTQLQNGGKIVLAQGGYTVIWPDSSYVRVNLRASYLNIKILLSETRRGRVEGLLGNFDGTRTNELITSGGESISDRPSLDELYNQYGESWRISQEQSLFDYLGGNTSDTHTDRTFPRGIVTVNSLSESTRQLAEQICRDAGISDPILLDACILDIGLTGDLSFADYPAGATPPEGSVIPGLFALQLDGSGDYLEIPSNLKNLGITNSFTISIRIKVEDVSGMYMLLEDGTQYNTSTFYLGVWPRERMVFARLNTTTSSYFNDRIPAPAFAGRWANLTYTYDGSVISLYMDEIPFFSRNISGNVRDGNRNLRIGFPSGEHFYNGLVDEFRIWNVALTVEEIISTLDKPLIGNELGLVGYWSFDEGSGLTASDLSFHHNSGTLFGDPAWIELDEPL